MTWTARSANPLVSFHDLEAGIKLMTDVFGFKELAVFRDDDGVIQHSEFGWGSTVVMPAPRNPVSPWAFGPVSLFLSVDNPDALHDAAVNAGLEIIQPLIDQPYGSREFAVKDDSDNVWIFGTYEGAKP